MGLPAARIAVGILATADAMTAAAVEVVTVFSNFLASFLHLAQSSVPVKEQLHLWYGLIIRSLIRGALYEQSP